MPPISILTAPTVRMEIGIKDYLMIIAVKYSFNGGAEVVAEKYPNLLDELTQALASVNAEEHRTKESKEKTMMGQMLYSPSSLNKAIKKPLFDQGWKNHREECDYSTDYYTDAYKSEVTEITGFRDMDFVKQKLGVEVQFGKYSFMVYNVAAKMTIFRNLEVIDAGIEVVPVKNSALQMSSGVSYFEQFVWDLSKRGVADIDVPVLILGIASEVEGSGKRIRGPKADALADALEREETTAKDDVLDL